MFAKFFGLILAKIAAVVAWFGKLATAVFTAAWDLVRDAVCWPFDQILEIVVSAISHIEMGDLVEKVMVWDDVPAEVLNVWGCLASVRHL